MPAPKENQILVKIRAAAVNPADYHNMHGGLVRLFGSGFTRPKDPSVGIDYAGVVEGVGSKVTSFHTGDEVFGSCNGSIAEFACGLETRSVLKPPNISFEEAAGVPVAAITALQGLRDKGKIRAGQKVLINGGSGGVGTFAVQIAKSFGTEVTAVCSTKNVDLVKSIGADHVIDYTKEDFTKNGESYDLICDVAGNRSATEYERALKPGGICVIVGFSTLGRFISNLVSAPIVSMTGNKKVGFMGIAKINKDDLTFVKELLEKGMLKVVIDMRYPLGETAKAIAYLETKHARGKVIVTVDNEQAMVRA
jgi:NADPH:quinone reductase-like Zn-dependent oxidoreductase